MQSIYADKMLKDSKGTIDSKLGAGATDLLRTAVNETAVGASQNAYAQNRKSEINKLRRQFKSDDEFNDYLEGIAIGWTNGQYDPERAEFRKQRRDRQESKVNDITAELESIDRAYYDPTYEGYIGNADADQFAALEARRNELTDERERLEADINKYDRFQAPLDRYNSGTSTFYAQAEEYKRTHPNDPVTQYLSGQNESNAIHRGSGTFNDPMIAGKSGKQRVFEGGLGLDTENHTVGNIQSHPEWNELTEEELNIYYGLAATKGEESARRWLDSMSNILGMRRAGEYRENLKDTNTLEKILLGAAQTPQRIASRSLAGAEDLANMFTGKGVNPYTGANLAMKESEATIGAAAEGLDNDLKFNILGQTPGKIYQGIVSGIDSFAQMMIGQVFGSAHLGEIGMALGAGAAEAAELWEKGIGNDTVLARSILAGTFEALFEHMSIEAFTKNFLESPITGWWDLVKKTGVQVFTEGSEEVFTDGANFISDLIHLRSQSEWAEMFNKYKAQGLTDGQAIVQSLLEEGSNLVDSFMGGVYGAFLTSAGGAMTQSWQSRNTGRQIISEGAAETLRKTAEELAGAEGLGEQYAQALNETTKKVGKKTTPSRVGYMYNAVENAINEGFGDNAEAALKAGTKVLKSLEKSTDIRTAETSDGQTVTINEDNPIARFEDGKAILNTSNGEMSVDDLSFADDSARLAYDNVNTYDVETANAVLNNYQSGDIARYLAGMREGIELHGKMNVPSEAVSYYSTLSEENQRYARTLGQTMRKSIVNKAVQAAKTGTIERFGATSDMRKVYEGKKKGAFGTKGAVYLLNDIGEDVAHFGENYDYLEAVADTTGAPVVFYDSNTVKNEQLKNANGKYVWKNGAIYVDLNAGPVNGKKGLVAFALSHELTHFAEQWSPEDYKTYADWLVSTYSGKGGSMESLVKARMASEGTDYEEAYHDVIADFSERMLLDSDVLEKLEALREKDKTVWQKIVDKIRTLVSRIIGAYGDENQTYESNAIQDLLNSEELQKMKELWSTAVVEGAKNRAAAVQRTETRRANENAAEIPTVTQFSMKSPVEQTKDLIAWHNISSSSIDGAIELGGFAMPSFAIMPSDRAHTTYGDISVIARKSSIDPQKNGSQKVFAGDAWTPVFPEVKYKLNENAVDNLAGKIYGLLNKTGVKPSELNLVLDKTNMTDKYDRRGGDFVENYRDNYGMKLAFIEDTERHVTIPTKEKQYTSHADIATLKKIAKAVNLDNPDAFGGDEMAYEPTVREIMREYAQKKYGDAAGIGKQKLVDMLYPADEPMSFTDVDRLIYAARQYLNSKETRQTDTAKLEKRIDSLMQSKKVQSEYDEWLKNLGEGLVERKGIRNNKALFTPTGNRRSWDALYGEYSLENIVRAMKGQPQQGRTQFLSGAGSVKGAALEAFSSLEQVRNSQNRLVSEENDDTKNAYDDFSENVKNLANKISDDLFTGSDMLADILSHAKTKDSIERYLRREYDFLRVQDGLDLGKIAAEIYELGQEANTLPMEYFEAKVYRAFPFSEAAAIIVPSNLDKNKVSQIKELGGNVLTYKTGDNEDRLKKANSVEDARFSRKVTPAENARYMELAEDPNKNYKQLTNMVKSAAERSGFTDEAYHGTYAFGRTVFDDWNGVMYLTDAPDVGRNFRGNQPVQPIGRYSDTSQLSDDEVIDFYRNNINWGEFREATEDDFVKEADRIEGWSEAEKINAEKLEAFRNGKKFYRFDYNTINRDYPNSPFADIDDFREMMDDRVSTSRGGGVYHMFVKPGRVLTVDAGGNYYTDLPIPAELRKYATAQEKARGYVTSDQLVRMFTRSNAYDTLKITNVIEGGDYGRTNKATDLVVKDARRQVRSADPVTYDNDGNVIPLTERFNEKNEDIRYSRKAAQKAWEDGDKLTKSQFYSFYSAHKLDMRKQGNVEEQIERIKSEGFKGQGGFGHNLMPTSQYVSYPTVEKYNRLLELEKEGVYEEGHADKWKAEQGDEYGKPEPSDVSVYKYGPRKGDYILLVPKPGAEITKSVDRVRPGWKPQYDYEIVRADYDYQPYYEMYSKAYDEYQKTRYSRKSSEDYSTRGIVERALKTLPEGAEKKALTEYKQTLDSYDAERMAYNAAVQAGDQDNVARAKNNMKTLSAKLERMENGKSLQNIAAVRDVKALNEDAKDLREMLRAQATETGGTVASKASAKIAADTLAERHNITKGKGELADLISELYTEVMTGVNNGAYSREQVLDMARSVSEWIDEKSSEEWEKANRKEDPEVKDVLNYIKGSRVRINENQKGDIRSRYDGKLIKWMGKLSGYVRVANNATMTLDELWNDLSKEYPHIFDPNTSDADQGVQLADIVSDLKSRRYVTEQDIEPNTEEYEDHIRDISEEVINALWEVKPQLTIADRYAKKIESLREKHNERMRETRRTFEQTIREQREASWQRGKEVAEARQKRRELRTRIKALHKNMSTRLLNPKENKYIPADLRKAVAEVLEAIDTDSGRSEKLTAKLNLMNARYKAIAQEERYHTAYDPYISQMITNLSEAIATAEADNAARGKRAGIYGMTSEHLEMLYTAMKAFDHAVRDDLKKHALGSALDDNLTTHDVGEKLIEETRQTADRSKWMNKLFAGHQLRPSEFFERLAGYKKDSYWMRVYRMLDNAQRRMKMIEMQSNGIFEDILKDEKYLKELVDTKTLVDLQLPGDVKITRGMMLSLYKHLLNEDNARHVAVGGLTVPGIKEYYKQDDEAFKSTKSKVPGFVGNELTEAYKAIEKELEPLEDAWERAAVDNDFEALDEIEKQRQALWSRRDAIIEMGMVIANELRQKIEGMLTDKDREFLAAADEYFDNYSKTVLNEATMAMYGFEKARVEGYFPIHTDSSFRQVKWDQLMGDFTLEGAGFMKDRMKGAVNPILLEDFSTVINQQISKVARYAGLAPALKEFSKLYGIVEGGNEFTTSVQDMIGRKFGAYGTKYIENLIEDLNGSSRREPTFLDKARSFAAGAVLTANIRVSLAQAASYTTAISELGHKAVAKALGKGIKRAPNDIINKYTALLWERKKGYTDVAMGDVRTMNKLFNRVNSKAKWLTGWIQAVDTATVGRLWYACEYWVQDNTDLEKGTDAYYMQVAEKFGDVIEKTQPSYSALQRPDVLRSRSQFTRALTMFMTQRLQNQNIVYGAVRRYHKYRQDYKSGINGVTEEDLKSARNEAVRSVASQIYSAALISGMKLFADVLLRNMGRRRDDEEEVTAQSVLLSSLSDMLSSLASNYLGGSELYDVISALMTGDKWYGISVGGIDALEGTLESFYKNLNGLVKGDGVNFKDLKGLLTDASNLVGLPVSNVYKLLNGVRKTIDDAAHGNFFSFKADGELLDWGKTVERTSKQKGNILLESALNGDDERYAEVYGEFNDSKSKTAGENADAALLEATKDAWIGEEISDEDAKTILKDKLGADEKTIAATLDKWQRKKNGEDIQGFSPYDTLKEAMRDYVDRPEGYNAAGGIEIKKAIQEYRDLGYTDEQIRRAITSEFKDEYVNADTSRRVEMKHFIVTLFVLCGKKESDAKKQVDGWLK